MLSFSRYILILLGASPFMAGLRSRSDFIHHQWCSPRLSSLLALILPPCLFSCHAYSSFTSISPSRPILTRGYLFDLSSIVISTILTSKVLIPLLETHSQLPGRDLIHSFLLSAITSPRLSIPWRSLAHFTLALSLLSRWLSHSSHASSVTLSR
ncbi:hypothetical protein BD626DRAFT_21251 [Schizophyllum amplum]|uniref:Uncharacterized protein n=1 Tax=Schizophyllum amplum TaxID=97359 RepID=A0A550CYV5_9AGAR|nr:hypothetical protein BD626DRAFT_21251 [Auriculariopsis ampla]